MPQFCLSYLGGNEPATPEEAKTHFADYMKWIKSLGEQAVSPMNPFKNTHIVHPDGTVATGGNTTMSGFTIIEAESMEAALIIVRACPFLQVGGALEVSEIVTMPEK